MTRHDLDLPSLVSGLTFAGLGIAAFAGQVGATVSQLRWVGAIVLTALGIGLILSARSPRPEDGSGDTPSPS